MPVIVASVNSTVGLFFKPGSVTQEADRYYFRPPVSGTYAFDGVVSDIASPGAVLASYFGSSQVLDPFFYPDLREATVSYGGGEYYFRYYYYEGFDFSNSYVRTVVGATLFDSQMAPILDVTNQGRELFTIDAATLAVFNANGSYLGALGGMDLWQMLLANEWTRVEGTDLADVISTSSWGGEILGMGGDDTLTGGAGEDYFYGGAGNDRMDGGAGNRDTVNFSPDTAGVTVTLDGANWVTAFVNSQATDVIRNVEDLNGGEGNDTLVGDTLGNWLEGDSGDDRLIGAGGDDLLEDSWREGDANGGGRDFLDGGAGFDLAAFFWQDVSTRVTLAGASTASVFFNGVAYDQVVNIEGVLGGYGDDTLVGDANANLLAGGSGNDVLDGKAGNDTLYAGYQSGGIDTLVGGLGVDTASWGTDSRFGYFFGLGFNGGTWEPLRISLNGDTAATIFMDGIASGTIRGVENLIGGEGNDTFTGDTLANRLTGGAGDDTLNGGGGADTLVGGYGNDTLNGGVGIDMMDYSVPPPDDSPLFSPYGITVFLDGVNEVQVLVGGFFGEIDLIKNIENVRGSANQDLIVGDALVNRLFGLGGNDNLVGLGGNDFLDGGAGVDNVYFDDKTQAVVLTLNGATQVFASVGGVNEDTILNVENVYGGSGNDVLTGDAKANLLYGADGADTLSGGGGADYLDGGAGVDTLDGGAGQDRVDYSTGTDGSTNFDSVVVTLQGSTSVAVKVGGSTVDNIKSIENIRGGSGADTLTGDGQVNVLDGGAGADILKGGLGNDVLIGGFDSDEDRFIFDSALGASNVDTVRMFTVGVDKIVLDDDIFTRFTGLTSLNAANYVEGPAALDSNDYIIFDDRLNVLLYDADGSGAGQAVRFAVLQAVEDPSYIGLSANDFVVIA